ncbi:hypothetical protein [Phaeospirillum tilakii]|uniref:Beta-barrel porin 2 n=1 Tax=Phaeospirillum tilakii TaxID=741673 RepID=A0ABW5CC58_9PROT
MSQALGVPSRRAVARVAAPAVLAAALAGWPGPARSQQAPAPVPSSSLTLIGSIGERFEATSNPLLQAGSTDVLVGEVTTPKLTIERRTPTSSLALDSQMEVSAYNLDSYDSTDNHSTLKASTQGERWVLGFNGAFDYDTTRTSEETGSGVNITGIRHTGVTLTPLALYAVTPTDSLQVQASLFNSAYADKQRYTDYRTTGLSPTWQHALSPTSALVATLMLNEYETRHGPRISIFTWSPQLGWKGDLTETLTLAVMAGYQQSSTDSPDGMQTSGQGGSNGDYNFSVLTTHRTELNTLDLRFSRQLNPQSDGTQTQALAFSLNDTYRIGPRLSAGLRAYLQQATYDSTNKQGDTVYANLSPRLSYALTDLVALDLSYQFRFQKNVSDQMARSNTILLGVTVKSDQVKIWE